MSLGSVLEAVVASRDTAAAARFLSEAFGWEVLGSGQDWTLTGLPGSPAGRVRLVAAEEDVRLPEPVFWEPGPRLLGIYSTDLDRTEEQVTRAGGRVGPIATFDAGLSTPLRERLAWGPDDLLWTIPDYEPRLPTPAIERDPSRVHGELHSAVIVVERMDSALEFFVTAGGLDVVFDGEVGGPEIEAQLGLAPGVTLRNAVLGGDDLAPARLELVQVFGAEPPPPARRRIGLRELVFGCDDPATTMDALLRAGGTRRGPARLGGPGGIDLTFRAI